MAGTTLETLRNFHQVLDVGIGLNLFPQLGHLLKGLGERDVPATHWRGYQLGNAIHFGIGHLQSSTNVLDCCSGRQGSEGNDLTNGIASVEVRYVVNNVPSSPDTKVDIDIGHRDATGVKETLEDEVVV